MAYKNKLTKLLIFGAYFAFVSLSQSKNINAINIDLGKLKSINLDKIDLNNDSTADLREKQEKEFLTKKDSGKGAKKDSIDLKGTFHFFNSHTNEDFRKNDEIEGLMQGDGRLTAYYEKEFDENSGYYASFEVKKKYENVARMKSLIGLKNSKYGELKIASFNPIFDDFSTYYDVAVNSGTAWTRNINTSFNHPDGVFSGVVNDVDSVLGYYTDYDLTSIMYKSPKFKDVQLAVSYTNDTRYKKKVAKNFPYKNVLSLLATYDKKISPDLRFKLSFLTEFGNSYQRDLNGNNIKDDPLLDDLRSVIASALVEYKKFQIVGTYGNFFKTNGFSMIPILNSTPLNPNKNGLLIESKDTQYFNAAASYKCTDKIKVSISQFYSESGQDYAALSPEIPSTNGLTGKVKFYNTSLGASYSLYNGIFVPYVEITKFKVKDNNAIIDSDRKSDNDGYVVLLGARAKF